MPEHSVCRLCCGPVSFVFKKLLLQQHQVAYFKCGRCFSLQTETPYWLHEAYEDDRPLTDCGMVARTIDLSMKMDLIFSILKVENDLPCIDAGGSLGLFARMMRDRGYNFFRSDKYSRNFYVPFHDAEENGLKFATVVTAFEVLEHLPNPKHDLNEILALSPDVFIASTETYRDQPSDWWYYAPDNGQHLFFYSYPALLAIAECYGMHLITNGALHVFCRKSPRSLSYGPNEISRVAQLFQDGHQFNLQSLNLFMSRLGEPYKWVNKDYGEILVQLREKQNEAARSLLLQQ